MQVRSAWRRVVFLYKVRMRRSLNARKKRMRATLLAFPRRVDACSRQLCVRGRCGGGGTGRCNYDGRRFLLQLRLLAGLCNYRRLGTSSSRKPVSGLRQRGGRTGLAPRVVGQRSSSLPSSSLRLRRGVTTNRLGGLGGLGQLR